MPVVVRRPPRTPTLVQVVAKSFLATKISFINAMAQMCQATGADVSSLAHAIGYDGRIGRRFLKAGFGFGGGCLPKDIQAFQARKPRSSGSARPVGFLHEVDEINVRRRHHTVDLARELVGGNLEGERVAALGAAFKPQLG